MTRITNATRDAIVENAIAKKGIPTRTAELAERRKAWAEKCRIQALGGADAEKELIEKDRQFNELIESVPVKLREYTNGRHIANREHWLRANFAGCAYDIPLDGSQMAPRANRDNRAVFEQGDPLTVEFFALQDAETALENERRQVAQSVRAAVGSVTTVKRLLELWPEVAELLPPTEEAARTNLQALQVADLNAMLGLPTEQPAAE